MPNFKVDPNGLERLRRDEGLKNPADLEDISTREEILLEIEREFAAKEMRVEYFVNEEALSPEAKRHLEEARIFMGSITLKFKERFSELIREYSEKKRAVSAEMLGYLSSHKLDVPSFGVYDRASAPAFLRDAKLSPVEIGSESLLVVFNLPKPLAYFWWKGGTDSWGFSGEDIGSTAVEWGHFYRELMPVVWEEVGFAECEGKIEIERINDAGIHDPGKFYYVWKLAHFVSREAESYG